MELHFYDSLPSTNRTAAEAARAGAGEFYTVIAKEQTQGRGRMTRTFHSPIGGTYFSTVLRPKMSASDYGRITPMAAVAVHRALWHVTGVRTEIKWVNDILLGGRKLCGILAESGTDQNGEPFVILGIGINTAEVDFPQELQGIAACLPVSDTSLLIGAILAELAEYERIIAQGAWLDDYREHCAHLGEEILVIEGDRSRLGTALDVLADGALRVALEGGIEDLRGGEISIRPAQFY